tara:strand:+ start:137 stop:352 length:216 start_codon:yes stop_codon:yes gene_type:complete
MDSAKIISLKDNQYVVGKSGTINIRGLTRSMNTWIISKKSKSTYNCTLFISNSTFGKRSGARAGSSKLFQF